MTMRTALGWLFVALGFVLFGVDVLSLLDAIHRHAPPVIPAIVLLAISQVLVFLGGLIILPSDVGTAGGKLLELVRGAWVLRPGAKAPPSDPPAEG